MKIAIDARISKTTTGRYVDQLIEYLQRIDTENDYVVILPETLKGEWQPTNPRFSATYVPYKNYSLGEQIGFLKFLNSLKADLVHFAMIQQPLLYRGTKVTTIHDLTLIKTYNSDKNWLVFHAKQMVGKVVFFVVARTSKKLIAISKFTKDEFVNYTRINLDKMPVIYEGSDMPLSSPVPYVDLQNKDFIMYVGNQSDYKNVRRLVQAHQLLLAHHPTLQLVFVGKLSGLNGVTLRRNKQWVEENGFKNILYTDYVSDEQLAWLYQNTKAYVFPSLMEGFGLPGLEAMQCGAPVVSSNATCLPEIYGNAAHYFDPTNVDDMRRAIDDVLTIPELRERLIKAGYEQNKQYSWQTMAEETLQVYIDALR